ncbi:MAG: AI-2E family transporter [Proteobacteria bacterium]|nr:AI-2E family transporter [Pseudomonadota bacterium]
MAKAPPPPPDAGLNPYEASRLRLMRTIASCGLLLTIFASLFVLWLTRELVTPLIIAVFLLILTDAISRRLEKWFPTSPDWLRLSVTFLFLIGVLGLAILVTIQSSKGISGEFGLIKQKLQTLATTMTGRLGMAPETVQEAIDDFDFKPLIGGALRTGRHLATDFVFVVVYLGFMIASRAAFARKMSLLFPRPESQTHAQRVFHRVRDGAEGYVGIQTFKAAVMAAISYGLMAAIGLPNAGFLAFLIFLGAYIPLLGAAAAVIVPVLLAFAEFDLSWRPVVLLIALQSVVLVLDNIILPRLQADHLDVDPVVVLLSLAFWSLIFGVAGALLSTPLTVVVIALSAEFRSMRWLAILLSKKGDPAVQLAEAEARGAAS